MIRLNSAVSIAQSFGLNCSVTSLNLENNSLGPSGGGMLGSILERNKTLTYVNIAHNSIDATACLVICQGCIHNNIIKTLNLDGNPIGSTGGGFKLTNCLFIYF